VVREHRVLGYSIRGRDLEDFGVDVQRRRDHVLPRQGGGDVEGKPDEREGGFGNGFRIEASAAAFRTGDYALRVKDGG
jgi:hypothetical protein